MIRLRLLTVNIGWKLLSLGVAVFLWVALVGSPEITKAVSASVEFKNTPKDIEISSEIPEKVRLDIQGPSSRIRDFNLDNAAVVLDLSLITQAGEKTFPIGQANVKLPSGIVLLRAIPSELRLSFERLAWRDIPVRVNFASPPPAGFRVLREEVSPSRLKIVGPEGHVSRIETALTDPVDLAGVVGEKRFQVNAFIEDPLVRFQSSPTVIVRIMMEKNPQEASPGGETVVRH